MTNHSQPVPHPASVSARAPIVAPRVSARRRTALLASVALGLVAVYGLGAPLAKADFFSSPAKAQVSEKAKRAAAPVGFADVVETVKPSVISVRIKVGEPAADGKPGESPFPPGSPMERFFRYFGTPDGHPPGMRPGPGLRPGPRGPNHVSGQGSGFFISADGYAVTNNHVVDGAERVEIVTDDGKTYTAKVIGTDQRTDLALIKVEGGDNFPYATLADTLPRIGDWVLAVGNPFGLGGTVTAGIVSARGRDIGAGPYDDFLQIDAPVNKGNSGGPAFNAEGQVIGVNTAIYSPSGGNVGIAFAIPASTVKSVVEQLKTSGSVARGWIGVQIQPVTNEIAESLGMKKAQGALIAEAQSDGPAVKAGIEAGDVIAKVDGEEIRDARHLARVIGTKSPGTKVEIGVIRKGAEKNVSLTLGKLPGTLQTATPAVPKDEPGAPMPDLGLTLAPASTVAGAGGKGVVVTNVEANSAAAERGLKAGDVLLEVGGKNVTTPGEVKDAIGAARGDGKSSVLVRVKSGESTRFVAMPVKKG